MALLSKAIMNDRVVIVIGLQMYLLSSELKLVPVMCNKCSSTVLSGTCYPGPTACPGARKEDSHLLSPFPLCWLELSV